MTLAWLYVVALSAALAASLLRRCPWRWFTFACACWCLQAVNVNLAQPTDEWTRNWRYPEALLMFATAGACVEAIERTRKFAGEPFKRLQLRVASLAIPASAVGLGVFFVAPVAEFNQARMWLWIFLALALLIVELLVDLQRIVRPVGIRWHLRLLLAVMLSHAMLSPLWAVESDATWHALRTGSRALAIVCCSGWVAVGQRERAL